jgi:hypothetical protein
MSAPKLITHIVLTRSSNSPTRAHRFRLPLEKLPYVLSERQVLFPRLVGQRIVDLVLDFYGNPFRHAACFSTCVLHVRAICEPSRYWQENRAKQPLD